MRSEQGIFGGRKSLFGGEGSEEVVVDLNLTPLMDVMSNILFFLLASFGAAILSFMAASIPVQDDSETVTTQAPRTDKVIVNIRIVATGYRVNLSADKVDPAQLAKYTRTIDKKDGQYDRSALAALAVEVKTAFPASDTAVIVPSDNTVYNDIIKTMEVVRYHSAGNKRARLISKIVVAEIAKGGVE